MGTFRFKLPDIGEGVVEAEITAWHVAVGDEVSEDDPIADAMTDKATIELTSPVDGVISKVACEEGEMLAVGADLVVFKTEGGDEDDEAEEAEPETVAELEPETSEDVTPLATAIAPKAKTPSVPKPVSKPIKSRRASDKVMASPAVRRRAESLGLNLSDIPAAGDRLTHEDLDAYLLEGAKPKAAPSDKPESSSPKVASASKANDSKADASKIEDEPIEGETRIKVIGLRRVIAQRMQEAKRHIPHFTYVDEIDVTALEAMRRRANGKKADNKPKLTVLPLLIRALAVTLEDWPQFNARYEDDKGYISQFKNLNLGMATQTDQGLIVPVLQKANEMSLWQMADEISRLAEAARTNTLDPNDLKGATTTLTSLGPLGGIVTTPVINRPEVAIFGPNKIRSKLVLEDEKPVERKVMNFSISCDHRVIDGYDAAAMIQDLKAKLEDPASIFLL